MDLFRKAVGCLISQRNLKNATLDYLARIYFWTRRRLKLHYDVRASTKSWQGTCVVEAEDRDCEGPPPLLRGRRCTTTVGSRAQTRPSGPAQGCPQTPTAPGFSRWPHPAWRPRPAAPATARPGASSCLRTLAVLFLRFRPHVAAGREDMAVLADILQGGALAESGDVFVGVSRLVPGLSL